MGLAMNTLGILIHDGLHGLLAKSKPMNHVWSVLCGLPLLVSASAYRKTRTDHHFEFGRAMDYGTYRYWLVQTFSAEQLITLWLAPSLVMMALTNVRGLASHALGDLEDIYLSSRTVQSNRLVRFLFLDGKHHLEHHLFPQVPSYHLARVHRLVWRRLPRALYAPSYTRFLLEFFCAMGRMRLAPPPRLQDGTSSGADVIGPLTAPAHTPPPAHTSGQPAGARVALAPDSPPPDPAPRPAGASPRSPLTRRRGFRRSPA